MRITFIRPSMTPHKAKDAMEPLAIAMLAAYRQDEFDYKFYDNQYWFVQRINSSIFLSTLMSHRIICS